MAATIAASLAPCSALAEDRELTFRVLGEYDFAQDATGHGAILARYADRSLFENARLVLHYDTDTLLLGVDEVGRGPLRFIAHLRGEAIFGGLLTDYYQRGVLIPEHGFNASFIEAAAGAKWAASPEHFLTLQVAASRWLFGDSADTAGAPDFRRPNDLWMLQPRLFYTWWNPGTDVSVTQGHAPFPRVDGVILNVELGLDWRSDTEGWGVNRNAASAGTPDFENAPNAIGGGVHVEGRAGVWIGESSDKVPNNAEGIARWQFHLAGGYTSGDDLTYRRVGGMNPYVVPIAGAPWAGWLPEGYVSGEVSIHIPFRDHEFGALGGAAWIHDVCRARGAADDATCENENLSDEGGPDQGRGVYSASIFSELRLGEWQLDTRLGYVLPHVHLTREPHVSLFLSLGRSWAW